MWQELTLFSIFPCSSLKSSCELFNRLAFHVSSNKFTFRLISRFRSSRSSKGKKLKEPELLKFLRIFVRRSVSLSILLSILLCQAVRLSRHQASCMPVWLSVFCGCVAVRLSGFLAFWLSVRLSLHLFVRLSGYLFVFRLSVCLSVHTFVNLVVFSLIPCPYVYPPLPRPSLSQYVQPVSHSISVSKWASRFVKQWGSKWISQRSVSQSADQKSNQSTNKPISQSINWGICTYLFSFCSI